MRSRDNMCLQLNDYLGRIGVIIKHVDGVVCELVKLMIWSSNHIDDQLFFQDYFWRIIPSDGVLETPVSARGSLETGFSKSQLGSRHFYKCLGLGTRRNTPGPDPVPGPRNRPEPELGVGPNNLRVRVQKCG
jgi:hypothetical protein